MSRHHEPITTSRPFAPRDWLTAVRGALGDRFILNLFRVDIRSFQRWTAKRPYATEECIRENYLEKHEAILAALMRDGYEDIAQGIVDHHAGLVGCTLVSTTDATPDKENPIDEMLDDYPAVVSLHEAIREDAPMDEIRHRAEAAKRELDETVAAHRIASGAPR